MNQHESSAVLPAHIVREAERAIADAECPTGLSVHDGQARIQASYLRRLLQLARTAAAQPQPAGAAPAALKGGALARLAGMWCNDSAFVAWLSSTFPTQWRTAVESAAATPAREWAADVVRMVCDIDSRAQLDHDPAAAARFQRLVRGPYMRHLGAA